MVLKHKRRRNLFDFPSSNLPAAHPRTFINNDPARSYRNLFPKTNISFFIWTQRTLEAWYALGVINKMPVAILSQNKERPRSAKTTTTEGLRIRQVQSGFIR